MFFKYIFFFIYLFFIEKYIFKNYFCLPFLKFIIVVFKIKKKKINFFKNLFFFEKIVGQLPFVRKMKGKNYLCQVSLRKNSLNDFINFFIFFFKKNIKKLIKSLLNNNFSLNIINCNLDIKNIFKNFGYFFDLDKIYMYLIFNNKIKNIKLFNTFVKFYIKL